MQHIDVTVSTEVLVAMVTEAIRVGEAGTRGDYTEIGIVGRFLHESGALDLEDDGYGVTLDDI